MKVQGDNKYCNLLGCKVDYYCRQNRSGMFWQHSKAFLPEVSNIVPCSLNEQLCSVQKESSGLIEDPRLVNLGGNGRLCKIEIPPDGQLAQVRMLLESDKERNWVSWPSVGFRVFFGQLRQIPPLAAACYDLPRLATGCHV